MTSSSLRLASALVAVSFLHLACYNSYQITPDELEKLDSRNISESVKIQTSEGEVTVGATTPIEVLTTSGSSYAVSPFNFILNQSQLVAPDYDLLLPRDQVAGAEVKEYAQGKTIGLIIGGVVVAVGSFVAISLLAGKDRELGSN